MIPEFPDSKKLEITDKAEIEDLTKNFAPYSDFEFESLWSWDVKEEMKLSTLFGNLVIWFTDYTTGEAFFTFLGSNNVNETARTLLTASTSLSMLSSLNLVPEVSTIGLDRDFFVIEDSRDHFDYICDIKNHLDYPGDKLRSHRKRLRQFTETYPTYEAVHLDMTSDKAKSEVTDVYRKWDENKGFITTSEAFAYERFLNSAEHLSYSAVGIKVDGKLVAFHIVSLPPGNCASALFGKADVTYRGIYPALDMVVAQDLLERGYSFMNIQQDLGIQNLRAAKLAIQPSYFLKKYRVSMYR